MVEISKSGSGEGLGWVTGPGYSTSEEEIERLKGSCVSLSRILFILSNLLLRAEPQTSSVSPRETLLVPVLTRPLPVSDLRQILAVRGDVFAMLDELVAQALPQMACGGT
jgi:hypothetical protein